MREAQEVERLRPSEATALVKHNINSAAWIAIGCSASLGFTVLLVVEVLAWVVASSSSDRLTAMSGKPTSQPSPAP
jgi:hypothetical protein